MKGALLKCIYCKLEKIVKKISTKAKDGFNFFGVLFAFI